MIFDLNIKNKYLEFENLHLDFSRYGVYILSGPNGVGKSTIMRQLVFGNNICNFNTIAQKQAYDNSRQELITYIEQDPTPDSTSIKNFLYKGKASIDTDLLEKLIKMFSLDSIKLTQSVSSLSGGEFCKFNIIAGLLKKTPYIFMDEPTNNFDNEAVRELLQIIKSLYTQRTFIIVSHDPRLFISDAVVIDIVHGKAVVRTKTTALLNTSPKSSNQIPRIRLLVQHLTRGSVIISGFFYLMVFSFAILVNQVLFNSLHNFDTLPNIQDCIATYKADQVYGKLNETYARAENIEVVDTARNRMILFNDIPIIASMPHIEKIVFSDESYIYEISNRIENQIADSSNIVSIPQDFISNFGDIVSSFSIDIRLLSDGRLPRDGAKEVALSEDILKNDFGFANYKQAKGQKINLLDEFYTVVGCTLYDVCMISYEPNSTFGYIEYNPDTYYDKTHEISKYLMDIDATIDNGPSNVIIYTAAGYEKTTLDWLIRDYAAENYISYEFISAFARETNYNATIITIVCNVAYILGISLMAVLIFKKSSILFKNELHLLEVYYISKNVPRYIFIAARFIQELILAVICVLFAKLILKDFSNIWYWLIIDYAVITFPVFIFYKHDCIDI